ncbi:MAG: hypothetical protein O3B34_00900 [Bacteroidetes bacterium]|nr:hypothetical protein [Bacteroidota bacterium]
MRARILLSLSLLFQFANCQSEIYRDENGIIKCIDEVSIGFIGEVDGAQVAENKAKALEAKKKRKPRKGINVSSTDRETGAPAVSPIEEIETQGFDFMEPDAAQGFEEFINTEESSTDADFDQLIEEEVPKLVQKRKDNKGREIRTFSNSKDEKGVKKTEYYSEREGQRIPTGGVVFSEESTSNFDDLLKNFNIPKEEFTQVVGEDAEAVALVASETDGKKGKIDLVVKKPEGTVELCNPFIEAPVEAAPTPKREEQLPYSNIANQNHRTYSVGTVTAYPHVKALLTLVLGVFVLILLAYAILLAIFAYYATGGGGMLTGGAVRWGRVFLAEFLVGLATWGYIMLMKKFWKKSSKS